jgi:hypothetical protein
VRHRLTLIACLLMGALTAPLAAERPLPEFLQPPEVQQQVLADLGSGSLSVIYERAYGREFSWQVSPYFWGGAYTSQNYTTSTGVKLGGDWWLHQDFWPHPETALLGWWAGPQVSLNNWHNHWTDGAGGAHDETANSASVGVQGGYQWVFHPGLTARLYAQVDALGWDLTHSSTWVGGYNGIGPLTPHAAVGWSF